MTTHTLPEWSSLNIGNNESDDRNVITSDNAERLFAASKNILPSDPGNFDVLTLDKDKIHAHGMVGLLQVDGCSLEILPKINVKAGSESERDALVRKRFALMIAVALGLSADDDLQSSVNGHNGNIVELLIGIFAKKLFDAVGKKLPKTYIESELWPSASDSPAILSWKCSLSEIVDSDRTLNQILNAAIALMSIISMASRNRQELDRLSSVFADIPVVSANEIQWNRVLEWQMDDRWQELHSMSLFFLNWVNLIKTTGESVEEYSLFVDMGQLFDAYVVALVKRIDYELKGLTNSKLEFSYRDEDDCTLAVMRTRQVPSGSDPCMDIGYKGMPEQIIEPRWKKVGTLNESDVNRMQHEWAMFDSPHTVLLYPHSGDFGEKEGLQEIVRVERTEFWDNKYELATFDVADGLLEVDRLQKILCNMNCCDNAEELRIRENAAD